MSKDPSDDRFRAYANSITTEKSFFRCRSLFHVEAAWDSSLHNSIQLNRYERKSAFLRYLLFTHFRITPSGERVFVTVSIYVEVRCDFVRSIGSAILYL